MKNYRILLICLIWLYYAKRIKSAEDSECYRKGLIRGKLGKTCHLPPIFSQRCQEEFTNGCVKFRKYAYCTLGVESALQGFPCEGLEDVSEQLTQTYQKCCNLCSSGLQAESQSTCDQMNKEDPFHQCCLKGKANETSILPQVFKLDSNIVKPCPLCIPLSTGRTYCICGDKSERIHKLEQGIGTNAMPSEFSPGQNVDTRPKTESLLKPPQALHRRGLTTTCPDGFAYNIKDKVCQDIDECKLGTARCEDENKACKNLNGSFECYDCPNGFKLGKNGQCGSACQPGYHLNETSKECEDIDECNLTPSPCRSNEKCFNTHGGHTCVSNKTCEPGHELNILGYCGDIDECSKGLHNCTFENSMCQNIFGGFKCGCKEGFRLGAGRDVCEDIDECKDQFIPCMGSKCINTLGSFECKGCEAGYKEDENGFCVDINECEEQTHKCGNYSCTNNEGSHECSCDLGGYKFENETCVDIDECKEYENICGHELCYNLEGSYGCMKIPTG